MNFKEIKKGLEFLIACQQPIGNPYQCHCEITESYMRATNSYFSMAIPLQISNVPVRLIPHTIKLLEVLNTTNCDISSFSLSANCIELKSKRMKFKIPILPDPTLIPNFTVDPIIGSMSDKLKDSIRILSPVTNETSQHVMQAAIHIDKGQSTVCNTRMAVQHYSGVDTPEVLIPIRAAKMIISKTESLVGYGLGKDSMSFHFEDGAVFMTQIFDIKEWKNAHSILDGFEKTEVFEVSPTLRDGFKIVSGFADSFVDIHSDKISSVSSSKNTSAEYNIEGGSYEVRRFNTEDFALVLRYAKLITFDGAKKTPFFGDNTRGVIMNVRVNA